jgi:hypothetical protein
MSRFNRRFFLRGLGGVAVGLPLLESLRPRGAHARDAVQADPFVIFLRQPNGVASAQNTQEVGAEPERFWPTQLGALTPDTVSGRALDELTDYLNKLLVVGNVNYESFDYGDGHARGVIQALTGRGPQAGTYAGGAEASGESLDMYIARQLNPGGADSLYLYAGAANGWLGGPCISHRGAGVRHAAERNPYNAFQNLFGSASGDEEADARQAARRGSVNDLVRDQMSRLMAHPRLSGFDRQRLEDHFDAIRDVEVAVTCQRDATEEAAIQGAAAGFDDPTGDNLVATAEAHLRVAALAVACGVQRSVVLQVGVGNGGDLRFNDPDTGQLMENYHFISHRRLSHGSDGAVIANSDLMHHQVDRHFARMFKTLLDAVSDFQMPDGGSLLDAGLCVWLNDNSNGPQHCTWDAPWILAGGAGGYFKQGEYLDAVDRGGAGARCGRSAAQAPTTLTRLHNTIATAVGVRKADGGDVDDFGDPALPGGLLPSLLA